MVQVRSPGCAFWSGIRIRRSSISSVLVPARMHREDVALRSVEPGQHDEPAADRDVRDTPSDRGLEDQPGVRRALVTLSGREIAVHERGFHLADAMHLEHRHDSCDPSVLTAVGRAYGRKPASWKVFDSTRGAGKIAMTEVDRVIGP